MPSKTILVDVCASDEVHCVGARGCPECTAGRKPYKMEFKQRTLMQIANMICGNFQEGEASYFRYRSSSYLTEFFQDCDTDYVHDGTTRNYWVAETLKEILAGPQPTANVPPETFARVVRTLMDQGDAHNEASERPKALEMLNSALTREGFEAFYAEDKQCYLRHLKTNTIAAPGPNPHRPFSAAELKRKDQLVAFLEQVSEDELIEEVLLPLFRQLGFHRITAAGHKDSASDAERFARSPARYGAGRCCDPRPTGPDATRLCEAS